MTWKVSHWVSIHYVMSPPCVFLLHVHVAPSAGPLRVFISSMFMSLRVYFSYLCLSLLVSVAPCVRPLRVHVSSVCMSPPCVSPLRCMSPSCINPLRVIFMFPSCHVYVSFMYMSLRVYIVCPLHIYVPSVCISLPDVCPSMSPPCLFLLHVNVAPCICPLRVHVRSVCMSPLCVCPLRVYVPFVWMSPSCVCTLRVICMSLSCHVYISLIWYPSVCISLRMYAPYVCCSLCMSPPCVCPLPGYVPLCVCPIGCTFTVCIICRVYTLPWVCRQGCVMTVTSTPCPSCDVTSMLAYLTLPALRGWV